ncbi:MAG: antitoxin component YwqK of YwqJK toxin-antitoxin module [Flavobacteriales bacterium]|jgi:antitoxin component YwqK of YwqJK toxin-antitoxin module|tara:strand:+ start:258 stop:1091 length:834 start_codon:yes stop_codon:yes gene_type:complete
MNTKFNLFLILIGMSFLGQAQLELIGSDTIVIPCPQQTYYYDGFVLKPDMPGGSWKDINLFGWKAIIKNDSIFPLNVINNTRTEFHPLVYKLEINNIEYLDTAIIQFKNRLSYYSSTSPSVWSNSFNCGDTILLEWENPVDSVVYKDGIVRSDTFIVKNNYEVHTYYGYVDGCRLDYGYDSYSDSISYYPQEKCSNITSTNNSNLEEVFEIYPNPSSGIFNVSNKKGIVSVFDFSGRVLLKEKINNGIIDMNHFQPGSYLIKFRDENLIFTEIGVIK